MFTKKEALSEINEAQDSYVTDLIKIIENGGDKTGGLSEIDFTSPTGTGKTVMVAKLINRMPNYFFVITTLSKGQLRIQIEEKLKELVTGVNFLVFGLNEYTKTTKLQRDEIDSRIDWTRKVIWIRDEGHIATNRWSEVLRKKAYKIVNFSATNKYNNGIQCNFAHTMMLRTVSQEAGTPEDALDKLVQVKKAHSSVSDYNPCALFRILHASHLERIEKACSERGLSYINITDEDYDMADICRDDNRYDVIINKFKITEGIDLRRCHVIYMDSKPGNDATVVQIIGRARRNALFWRNDIDILKPSMSDVLEETRRCFVFYNIPETEVEITDSGELAYSLCDTISVEALKPGIKIKVTDGQLPNGLFVMELEGKTGVFTIQKDELLGFNVVDNPSFYAEKRASKNVLDVDLTDDGFTIRRLYLKPNILDFFYYENWRGNWKVDIWKRNFYIWRKYSQLKGIDIDFDYWGSFLGVDRKDKLVSERRIFEFARDPKNKGMLRLFGKNGMETVRPWLEEALEFSKKGRSSIVLEKQNIFTTERYGFETTFRESFIPFIAKAEYFDLQPIELIRTGVEKSNKVKMLGPNRFRVANHPLSDYLIDRGMGDFNEFKKTILTAKGKTIFLAKVDYWKRAIEASKSYSQLDEFDSRVVDLEEINTLLSLGLSKKEIKTSSRGDYIIRTCSGKALKKLPIYRIRTDGAVDYASPPRIKNLYRSAFDGRYLPYEKTLNDKEIAAIGPDTMKFAGGRYIEDRAVTSKISKYSKFRLFITERYKTQIDAASSQLFSGTNDFGFDKKCNSCLGFCVEYYAKIKLFGDDVYRAFIDEAMAEAKVSEANDLVRVRAAMIIYRDEMVRCYGKKLAGLIPSIGVEYLVKENYEPFVAKVIELGCKTAEFVKHHVYKDHIPQIGHFNDPDLSVNHIFALCDFVSEDTILDVKCTSSITAQHVLQVLGYHYLSTKRSDLNVKKLIVFEAVTGKALTISV